MASLILRSITLLRPPIILSMRTDADGESTIAEKLSRDSDASRLIPFHVIAHDTERRVVRCIVENKCMRAGNFASVTQRSIAAERLVR